MISALFVVADDGKLLLEELLHRNVHPRAIVAHALELVGNNAASGVVALAKYSCFVVHRSAGGLRWLAIIDSDDSPALILLFLDRLAALLPLFIGELSEKALIDQAGIVKELLGEVFFAGCSITTESNYLSDVLSSNDIFTKLASVVTGHVPVFNRMPTDVVRASLVPWRKCNVRYTSDEIYLDLNESLDLIIDKSNQIIGGAGILGSAMCNCRLSGMPDITLKLGNSMNLFDSHSAIQVHPSVRYAKLERSNIFSFIPPDGEFELFSYRIPFQTAKAIPVTVVPLFSYMGSTLNMDVTITSNLFTTSTVDGSTQSLSTTVDDVILIIPLPKSSSQSINLSTSTGTWVYDQTSKSILWSIGSLSIDRKQAVLNGSVRLDSVHQVMTIMQLQFSVKGLSMSGLYVKQLLVHDETYKPYKGFRTHTRTHLVEIRV